MADRPGDFDNVDSFGSSDNFGDSDRYDNLRHADPSGTISDWSPVGSGRTAVRHGEFAVVCSGVRKIYRTVDEQVEALRDVDKDFPAGRVTVIVGPSGSGKSSLLRILACVDRPDGGSVRIGGTEVARLGARRRRRLRRNAVGYVFQNPMDNLIEYLAVREQLLLAARLRGVRPTPDEVDRLLGVLGLTHRTAHRPVQLSGGEQQRLAVACSVIGGPSVVAADEPTAELDSASADRVLAAMRDMRAEGVAFVVSSHDPRVAEAADHLLRLEHGRVAESW